MGLGDGTVIDVGVIAAVSACVPVDGRIWRDGSWWHIICAHHGLDGTTLGRKTIRLGEHTCNNCLPGGARGHGFASSFKDAADALRTEMCSLGASLHQLARSAL